MFLLRQFFAILRAIRGAGTRGETPIGASKGDFADREIGVSGD
jgi:hypothetical protein